VDVYTFFIYIANLPKTVETVTIFGTFLINTGINPGVNESLNLFPIRRIPFRRNPIGARERLPRPKWLLWRNAVSGGEFKKLGITYTTRVRFSGIPVCSIVE
jgi:hypothetical protein